MNFFKKIAAKQKGTLVLKDVLMKAPLPGGAQTLAQAYKSWAASLKSMKNIQITKANRSDINSWKVDLPKQTGALSSSER